MFSSLKSRGNPFTKMLVFFECGDLWDDFPEDLDPGLFTRSPAADALATASRDSAGGGGALIAPEATFEEPGGPTSFPDLRAQSA